MVVIETALFCNDIGDVRNDLISLRKLLKGCDIIDVLPGGFEWSLTILFELDK